LESRLLHRSQLEDLRAWSGIECGSWWSLRWSNRKLWPRRARRWLCAQSRRAHGSARTHSRTGKMITIAIGKGRMQESALALLARAGIRLNDGVNSRRLALMDETKQYRFIFVKPADVPVYVEHGIADCGIVGRDVLLESEADLLLPLDLGISRCRIVVAAADADAMTKVQGMIRVATKYSQIARAHFGSRGIPVEIIQLSGSVELAPALGLADMIV